MMRFMVNAVTGVALILALIVIETVAFMTISGADDLRELMTAILSAVAFHLLLIAAAVCVFSRP